VARGNIKQLKAVLRYTHLIVFSPLTAMN